MTANPHRLSSDTNLASIKRNEVILAFEAEFDTEVSPFMQWGPRDQFHYHEDRIYYYKPNLEHVISTFADAHIADQSNPTHVSFINSVKSIVPAFDETTSVPDTLSDIKTLIDSNPTFLPNFVVETPHFYEFDTVSGDNITLDEITTEMLVKIETAFADSVYAPFPTVPHNTMFLKDNKVYWTDLVRVSDDPIIKEHFKGILIESEVNTDKYPTAASKVYYFPFANFSTLPSNTQSLVNLFGANYASAVGKEFEIINL